MKKLKEYYVNIESAEIYEDKIVINANGKKISIISLGNDEIEFEIEN